MSLFKKLGHEGFLATEDLFLTKDQKTIVKEGDARAAFLLARKGQTVSNKIAKALGLTEESVAAEKTLSTEAIESRSTRPESVSRKR